MDTDHCGFASSHLILLPRQVAQPVRDFKCVFRAFILVIVASQVNAGSKDGKKLLLAVTYLKCEHDD